MRGSIRSQRLNITGRRSASSRSAPIAALLARANLNSLSLSFSLLLSLFSLPLVLSFSSVILTLTDRAVGVPVRTGGAEIDWRAARKRRAPPLPLPLPSAGHHRSRRAFQLWRAASWNFRGGWAISRRGPPGRDCSRSVARALDGQAEVGTGAPGRSRGIEGTP